MTEKTKSGLDLLREPFPQHLISKLPKPTKAQTEALRANFRIGERCDQCQGWHQPGVIHLDYVGHAALTDRLLDVDPNWNWEPLAYDALGLPLRDKDGGMWIKLTVCGITRLGYGDAGDKTGPNATKELIGDCLVRGTMIKTARGDVPIESVKIGDLVPTRAGWRAVIDHWLSAPNAPVVTATLSDGRSITGTPHHKVPTAGGEKRLAALLPGDIMHIGPDSDPQSHGLAFAPLTVVGIADAGFGEVWNISVDEVHEYVANGVLVMNSLRNAAMRFGAALDLWHKGDLHQDAQDSILGEGTQEKGQRQETAPKQQDLASTKAEPANRGRGDPYSDAEFRKILPKWGKTIKAGKTAAYVVEAVKKARTLLPDQEKLILGLGRKISDDQFMSIFETYGRDLADMYALTDNQLQELQEFRHV